MPRSIWTGAISFGLVNVPVKLFSATESKDVRFHQFERGTGQRVRYQRVAQDSGNEVAYDDIVKGYEVSKGEYVIVEPEELEAVEPGRSRAVEIEDFIDLDDVDPVYYEKTYHLAPANEAAAKPYQLLMDAMQRSNRAGVARFVMRGKQHLACIRPGDGALVLETMFFGDEVRDPAQIDEMGVLGDGVELSDRERSAALQLVESLTTEWDPTKYHDTYRERVLELVEAKAKGESIVTDRSEEKAEVLDLMAALEASVRNARQGRDPGDAPSASANGHGDLTDLSKSELYERAQERDIAGRSKMSRDELLDALSEAS